MNDTTVDQALNLDSSGTIDLDRPVVTGEAVPEQVPPDFPKARRRRDAQHRELLSHSFDAAEFRSR